MNTFYLFFNFFTLCNNHRVMYLLASGIVKLWEPHQQYRGLPMIIIGF